MRLSNLPLYLRGYLRSGRFTRPPIIVGGCERSGTTLLQSILSAHPRIHAIGEELWAFCYGPRAGFRRSRRPIRLSRLYKALGQGSIKPGTWRWSEKSPANVYCFGPILEHFGDDVRLIQIVRDGRDVTTSIHPARPSRPWVSIDRWIASVSAGLAWIDHPQVETIRYQDLVQDYERTVRSLCDFLDEDFTPQMREWHRHASIRNSRNLLREQVGRIRTSSVRKFEAPGFEYAHVVDQLLANPDSYRLLERFGFL